MGKPKSRHTYNGLTYVASADRMFAFSGAPAGPGGFSTDLWTLNLSSLSWESMDPVKGASRQQPKDFYTAVPPITVYDHNSNLVFILESAAGRLWSYDYTKNSYRYLAGSAAVPFNATPVLDAKRKTIFFFGNATAGPGDARKSWARRTFTS